MSKFLCGAHLSQVVLHDVSDDVWILFGEIYGVTTDFKTLTNAFHFRLDSRHSIDALNTQKKTNTDEEKTREVKVFRITLTSRARSSISATHLLTTKGTLDFEARTCAQKSTPNTVGRRSFRLRRLRPPGDNTSEPAKTQNNYVFVDIF